jgi:hypothetical protein
VNTELRVCLDRLDPGIYFLQLLYLGTPDWPNYGSGLIMDCNFSKIKKWFLCSDGRGTCSSCLSVYRCRAKTKLGGPQDICYMYA